MDSFNDCLVEAVKALGGSKVVGPMLWPEKMVDAAQRHLLDCLNPERPAHLTPEQAILVMAKARAAGNHQLAGWLMDHLGYAAPVPVEPKDELADLLRQYTEATKAHAETAARIEQAMARLTNQAAPRAALRAAA